MYHYSGLFYFLRVLWCKLLRNLYIGLYNHQIVKKELKAKRV